MRGVCLLAAALLLAQVRAAGAAEVGYNSPLERRTHDAADHDLHQRRL